MAFGDRSSSTVAVPSEERSAAGSQSRHKGEAFFSVSHHLLQELGSVCLRAGEWGAQSLPALEPGH